MNIHNPILTTVEKAVQDELRKAGRDVLKQSNENAPRRTGALAKSGQVRVDDLTVQISYKARHAALQHENLDYRHQKGGAKFLENAALEFDVEGAIAKGVRSALGG
ncbi:HK97 gp10 family phage protein [Microbacterium excoecariae]|uniref:HK97 gp10 family phage protein n=1 Tax=Microbacterium excoecariae TaxID=2715210 RepID=UPI00140AB177|nr:HK97 gp10 family phage protein [Microbacterium excoecariae]